MKQIKPTFALADEYLDLKTLDTNIIVDFLDEQIKLREMPLQAHIKKQLKR